ncbi:hypothetical protein AURDEDRAFT_110111 [Auricularia subglabra TFB-10046 SS5]|nr:hypothetical protein AURDEDRAFT_110111 [Auricularia subglabra TFB-10046 SS5]
MGFSALVGAESPFDAECSLVTSPFLSPLLLALARLLLALYMTVALLVVLIWQGTVTHDAHGYFSYFTELTGIGLAAYLWHSGTQTLAYALNARRSSLSAATYPLQRWPKALQVLHMILLASVRTLPFIVTVVFWALLASPTSLGTPYLRYDNISLHAMNSVCALFEILGTNTPVSKWLNLLFMELILAGYLGVAYITHETQGFYTYSFLNPDNGSGKLAGYICGIAAAEIIIFSLVQGVLFLRTRAFKRRNAPAPSMVELKVNGEDYESGRQVEAAK